LLPCHVISPALAAAGEVLAMGDQALVKVAGEHRDAVDAGVVAKLLQVMQTSDLQTN
jgi:hypothetical protein